MSRKKGRSIPPARPAGERPQRGQAPEVRPAEAGPRLSGWREWVVRCCLILLGPLVAFLLIEGALRLAGYGYPTSFFIKSDSGSGYITNEKYAWQYFSKQTPLKPFLFTLPVRKSPGTIRICILGESAAMGTPDPAYNFGRILEVLLRREYPGRRFEVINAAMRGINSYIVRSIAGECASYEVDLFIVYMGNNEVIGIHAPDPDSSAWAQSLPLIRSLECLKRTKLGQLLASLAEPKEPAAKQDMAYFRAHRVRADDWRRAKNRANFRANLEDICQAAARSGARVLLATLGSNMKDFPPLGSLHRQDLGGQEQTQWEEAYNKGVELEAKGQHRDAVQEYLAAARLDDHFAELHFRLARCYAAMGETIEASRHYSLARDWDALQLRADSRMNGIIREVAAAYQERGVRLVEVEQAFGRSPLSEGGLPGEKLFHDHVHPTFAGNYLLASNCYTGLVTALGESLGRAAAVDLPTAQECAEAIAYTRYAELNVIAAMVRLTSGPPFLDQLDHARRQAAAEADIQRALAVSSPQEAEKCLKICQAALAREPDYWPLRFNLGGFYQELGRNAAAVEQFQHVVQQYPSCKSFRMALGNALLQAGDKSGAYAQLSEALRLDPYDKALRQALARHERK